MGATSAVLLPAEINAEAFASPTLHAITSLIQVEPVVLRALAADLVALGTNNSARELFAVTFPVALGDITQYNIPDFIFF
jgi:hypothetical protein